MAINKAGLNKIARYFLWRKPVALIAAAFWKQRAKRIAKHLLPHISKGDRVLDIGAGSGAVSQALSRLIQADFTLIDVIDWNITNFFMVLFDGEHIPLSDKNFDVAFLADVLHHSEKEESLIKEVVRVSKKVIVIEEAASKNYLMRLLQNIGDNLQWLLYGMPIAVHCRTKEQWLEFFQKHYANVIEAGRYRNHAIFVLN